MKTVGIIAEYNPFHNGHAFQIEFARKKLGASHVIIAMSGDYVQRGTPALLPKHIRAEIALRCGADLVLELPASVCTASAEYFAQGGAALLDRLGCVNFLCFGSEAGDVDILMALASVLNKEPHAYQLLLKEKLRQGLSFPAARSAALCSYLENNPVFGSKAAAFSATETLFPSPEDICTVLSSPNNILGLEYCRALLRLNSTMRPVTLKRQGSGYHDISLSGSFSSASAIRAEIARIYARQGSPESNDPNQHHGAAANMQRFLTAGCAVPANAAAILQNALASHAFVLEKDFDPLFQYALLLEDKESLCRYADMTPELAARIINNRSSFQSFLQFASLLNTKETTQTRIQRALLHMLLRIRESRRQAPYARVLGFRRKSTPLLKKIKAHADIPLLTKTADASGLLDKDGYTCFQETVLASNIYEGVLCRKTGLPFVHEYEKSPVII